MLFNSVDFLIFFPCVAAAYFLLPLRYRWVLLLAASHGFYGYWNWAYVPLLLASTLIDYTVGRRMGQLSTRDARRPYLLVSIASNLCILFAFKYLGFFVQVIAFLSPALEGPLSLSAFDLLLPVGISFYTFQTLSYSIDVYRGRQAPERHLGYFALYVSFFPQLVAGPIERASTLLPQLRAASAFDWARVREGGLRMAWGLFKKVVVADGLATLTAPVHAEPAAYSAAVVVFVLYAFVYQLYCDFSGYTDVALGAAHVFGVRLSENFRQPFRATSAAALWKRWHITLMRWIRDYAYVPVARLSAHPAARLGAIFLTLFLFGIWHGASSTYLAFSLFIATVTTGEALVRRVRHQWQRQRTRLEPAAPSARGFRVPARLRMYVGRISVYTMFAIACAMLRAPDMASLQQFFVQTLQVEASWAALASVRAFAGAYDLALLGGCLVLVERIEAIGPQRAVWARVVRQPAWVRWAAYLALLFGTLLLGTFQLEPFIYFQF